MKFNKKSGKKKAAAAAVVCFVAAIAITGTYTFNNYKESKSDNDLAMAEENDVTKEKYTVSSKEEVIDQAVDGNVVANETDAADGDENTTSEEMNQDENTSGDMTEEKNSEAVNDITEEASISRAASVSFTKNSLILWPVSGTLLMDYSMDKTVYFKTLDQYKYNPAMIIGAAENDQIIAGASGLVKSIDNSAQTGITVNIDLGNGYEAFYGQLQNVAVKTGDYVEAATTLGYVAEPTKYYSSEGTNLYFEMRKDGQPIDPKEYLTDYVE